MTNLVSRSSKILQDWFYNRDMYQYLWFIYCFPVWFTLSGENYDIIHFSFGAVSSSQNIMFNVTVNQDETLTTSYDVRDSRSTFFVACQALLIRTAAVIRIILSVICRWPWYYRNFQSFSFPTSVDKVAPSVSCIAGISTYMVLMYIMYT